MRGLFCSSHQVYLKIILYNSGYMYFASFVFVLFKDDFLTVLFRTVKWEDE